MRIVEHHIESHAVALLGRLVGRSIDKTPHKTAGATHHLRQAEIALGVGRNKFRAQVDSLAHAGVGGHKRHRVGAEIGGVAEVVDVGQVDGALGKVDARAAEIGVEVERQIGKRVGREPQCEKVGVINVRPELVALTVGNVHKAIEIEAQIGVERAKPAAEFPAGNQSVDSERIDGASGVGDVVHRAVDVEVGTGAVAHNAVGADVEAQRGAVAHKPAGRNGRRFKARAHVVGLAAPFVDRRLKADAAQTGAQAAVGVDVGERSLGFSAKRDVAKRHNVALERGRVGIGVCCEQFGQLGARCCKTVHREAIDKAVGRAEMLKSNVGRKQRTVSERNL